MSLARLHSGKISILTSLGLSRKSLCTEGQRHTLFSSSPPFLSKDSQVQPSSLCYKLHTVKGALIITGIKSGMITY